VVQSSPIGGNDMRRTFLTRGTRYAAIGLLALAGAACTMKSQEAPDLTGPSEYALSITVSASPDVLSQDGASRSVITVTARGANGEPQSNVSMRAELQVDGTTTDFGSMSARNLVTGSDGRASLTYTAPAAPAVAVDNFTVVEVVIVPIGTDFNNSSTRRAAIRLVPPGVVIPPDGLAPTFTVAPEAPLDNQLVFFDASASTPVNGITSYTWNFGDGAGGSGRTATHAYQTVGTYFATLTIADQYGRAASTTRTVNVGAGINPTAGFVFSPASPRIGQTIAFNGSSSRPAAGRTIVGYTWDFGDGTGPRAGGATINYAYGAPGTYNVTLLVTDDTGKTAVVTQGVTVLP
jgi:PKD repeat protein